MKIIMKHSEMENFVNRMNDLELNIGDAISSNFGLEHDHETTNKFSKYISQVETLETVEYYWGKVSYDIADDEYTLFIHPEYVNEVTNLSTGFFIQYFGIIMNTFKLLMNLISVTEMNFNNLKERFTKMKSGKK